MPYATTFRRTLAAAVLGGTGLMMVSPVVPAQTPTATLAAPSKGSAAEALVTAQRDFAQFVRHQLQRKGGAPIAFPLDINDLEDLKGATISYGFPVYTIDPPDMLAGRGTMRAMAKPVNEWRFVIMLGQRAIGLATVEKIGGHYETVAYGAAVLAKDLDAAANYYGNADKSNLRFLRIYQARSDLLEVAGQDGVARFAPLHSARASLALQQRANKEGSPDAGLLEESDLVQPLRSAVKQNMAASR